MPQGHRESWLPARLPTILFGGARRELEPPLVRPRLPLIGDALQFGRDAGAYLSELRARHGDVFTVLIAGQRMTFVLHPHDGPRVLKENDALRFRDMADQISMRVFAHSVEILQRSQHADIQRMFNQHLKGDGLPELGSRMGQALLRHEPGPGQGDLYPMVSRWMFLAGSDVLWGQGLASDAAWQDFQRFDEAFPLLLAGAPGWVVRAATARQRLADRFGELRTDASQLMKDRQAYFSSRGSSRDQKALMVAILWAAVANTIPAAFWTVAHLLANPDALAAVRQELSEVPFPPADNSPSSFPYLDSALKEALRLASGALVLRHVVRDLELELEGGRRFRLRAGDRVCLYPYLTHHDPEVYADAARFQFDRFVAKDGPPQFFKSGRRLTIPLMLFGGGTTMCPGRFLATQEVKLFTAALLQRLDIELLEPLPPLQHSRAGLGVFPPAGPLQARWQRRGVSRAVAGRPAGALEQEA